ncbi:methyl-accepting chemotaxis protein [Mastigocladopsis repens]|uniref:methyl-accepting chemotaxis protein n=1 Tax=Mastigocladopsis repens TaxID=221287 RepID=UPI0002EBF868|nr:methyl-accepting chemotaxis protein [Mastigocladopsis repens]
MAASIEDCEQTYQQAYKAYVKGNYEEAATLINQVVQHLPEDANIRLLRGHVYYVLQQYDVAKAEYQKVLQFTDDKEIISFAQNGIDNITQYQQDLDSQVVEKQDNEDKNFSDSFESQTVSQQELENFGDEQGFNSSSFDLNLDEHQEAVENREISVSSPFDLPLDDSTVVGMSNSKENSSDDPFAVIPQEAEQLSHGSHGEAQAELELPNFWLEDMSQKSLQEPEKNSTLPTSGTNSANHNLEIQQQNISNSPFTQVGSTSSRLEDQAIFKDENSQEVNSRDFNLKISPFEDEMLTGETEINTSATKNNIKYSAQEQFSEIPQNSSQQEEVSKSDNHTVVPVSTEISSSFDSNFLDKQLGVDSRTQQNSFDDDDNDSFDFEAFESAFGLDETLSVENDKSSTRNGNLSKSNNVEFLDDFDEFDDLGKIPGFDLTGDSAFEDSQMRSASVENNGKSHTKVENAPSPENRGDFATDSTLKEDSVARSTPTDEGDSELFMMRSSQQGVPVFTEADVSNRELQVSVEQGFLAPLENAPLETKQWIVAGTVGFVSALVVAGVSFVSANFSPPQQRESLRNTGWAMTLAAGIAGFATTGIMGGFTLRQIRRTTQDLQAQFDAVRQGNLNVQATVSSADEFGQLAAGFNEMTRVMFTTTHEATRNAQEQEEAKENLQRQVIRLLDDVEGAARGDLTVQAEVTADVLGAVADAFNLTIQNLRDLVQQVKVAAREVTKGATNSETFARALSSDALRQAEELAVTLNSVQIMTDSIQRVAEAAREAEAVTRDAGEIALKGGEAVENTVAGILEIRETVAETTRKVKRLAESSQEISKIVALISQIASRTNLLALNASIEAARAGEAGRGFAIVADEVRQLADKSAKSLKEIEQIVMQIQSETGSVMTAMEEGTQQVIKGTRLAEEARRSLENIIQVAKRIDILVRGITSDTVEQTETSRAVAQVVQSVELTAQETSGEAQRVSGALQNLVGVSRDLITSVERFRVETAENTR